jgi:hypothetical protein
MYTICASYLLPYYYRLIKTRLALAFLLAGLECLSFAKRTAHPKEEMPLFWGMIFLMNEESNL